MNLLEILISLPYLYAIFLNPQNLWRLGPRCKHEYLDKVQNLVMKTGFNGNESEKLIKAQDCIRL